MASNDLKPLADPDDMFADTRMSFGDHIEDLRAHLIRAIFGFVIGLVICILPPIGPWALHFITNPVEQQLNEYFKNQEKARPELTADELKAIPPVKMIMYVDRAALRLALTDKNEPADKILESVPDAVDVILDAMQMKPTPADPAHDPNLAAIPVQIPDPVRIAKSINEVNLKLRPKHLTTLNVQEALIVYIKVGLLFGLVLSSPWVFYQIWSFIAVGLYPHEKRLVNYYLPISLGLFLAGIVVCEFFALPKAIEALLWFNEWLGFDPEFRLSEWLGFAILMPLVFGLSFQTPIVMMFTYKIGIASIESFRRVRRISYFGMAVFAAVVAPSTDIPTMMMLWVPMCLLYEVGIWLCILQGDSPIGDDSELDEMVGV